MATRNLTVMTAAHPYAQTEGAGRCYTKSIVVDTGELNMAASDVAQCITVPGNTFVHSVRLEVLTAEGGTLTLNVGDGTNTSGYLSASNGNALTEAISAPVALTEGTPNTITGYSGGKYYAADDTIDVVFSAAADKCKFKLTAVMFDFN